MGHTDDCSGMSVSSAKSPDLVIPAHLDTHEAMGIDVKQFAEAGVEMFDLSTYAHTEQPTSLGEFRPLAREKRRYAAQRTD